MNKSLAQFNQKPLLSGVLTGILTVNYKGVEIFFLTYGITDDTTK